MTHDSTVLYPGSMRTNIILSVLVLASDSLYVFVVDANNQRSPGFPINP